MKIFKNILLRIPYVISLIIPYVFIVFVLIWLEIDTKGDPINELMSIFVIFTLIGALSIYARIIISATVMSFKESSIWNLINKLVYAPIHFYLILKCDFNEVFSNGYYLLFYVLMLLFSNQLLEWSAASNISACAKGHDDGKLKLSTTIWMIILSYVYVADIICAIVQIKKSSVRRCL